MITDAQLQTYAKELPDIYREILAAFPRIEPTRRQGDSLAFQTLAADFDEREMGVGLSEIIQASEQLAQHGLAEIKHRIFVHPTPLGERLIAILTGRESRAVSVPKLPPLPA